MPGGGGVALDGGTSDEDGIEAVDFRLPKPKPLNLEFIELIRKDGRTGKREKKNSQSGGGWE